MGDSANSSRSKSVVIGAGSAGLACATKLVDLGRDVTVVEASPFVGGLARSLELWGQIVDLGPHRFFSHDRVVINFWSRFVGSEFTRVNRLTRIAYQGTFFLYPLDAADALRKLSPIDTVHALASYAKARARPIAEPRSFEDWVTNRFGGHLFRMFFKTYSEKVWGISCQELDADWAAQRIKKLSLFEAAKAAVFKDRGRTHKTLADEFKYPRGGSGVIYERMRQHIEAKGGSVRLSAPVKRVLVENGRAKGVELESGEVLHATHVVSSMPMTLMVRSLPDVPAEVVAATKRLRFRNTILVYLEIDSDTLFPDHWVYVHSPDVKHGRVTNFRNWCSSLTRGRTTSVLCVEFWCFEQDATWTLPDEQLASQAELELRKVNLLGAQHRVLNSYVHRLSRSYPVYDRGYQPAVETVQKYVDSIAGLLAIGRYGAFKYNNQDHSILMGLLAAVEVETGVRQGLWSVNSDSEYQESAEVRALEPTPDR